MKLAGFNFLKIHAEKASQNLVENLKLNTNIDISDIKEIKSDMLASREALLGINFEYNIVYEPKFANISFSGVAIISLPSKEAKDVMKDWSNKNLSDEFRLPLFNAILKKCNLKALQLEEELNLPTHLPLPSLKSPQQTKKE